MSPPARKRSHFSGTTLFRNKHWKPTWSSRAHTLRARAVCHHVAAFLVEQASRCLCGLFGVPEVFVFARGSRQGTQNGGAQCNDRRHFLFVADVVILVSIQVHNIQTAVSLHVSATGRPQHCRPPQIPSPSSLSFQATLNAAGTSTQIPQRVQWRSHVSFQQSQPHFKFGRVPLYRRTIKMCLQSEPAFLKAGELTIISRRPSSPSTTQGLLTHHSKRSTLRTGSSSSSSSNAACSAKTARGTFRPHSVVLSTLSRSSARAFVSWPSSTWSYPATSTKLRYLQDGDSVV